MVGGTVTLRVALVAVTVLVGTVLVGTVQVVTVLVAVKQFHGGTSTIYKH